MTVWFAKGRGKAVHKGEVGGWRYGFELFKQRHTSPRGFDIKQDALDAENELRRTIRRQRAGLEPLTRPESPRFIDTAGAYYEFVKDRQLVTDLDTVERMHLVILQFFGPRPTDPAKVRAGAKYHDLRLQDPIDDPSWILKFEDWMQKRGIAGATRNRYRSTVSRLYWFAMLPERRAQSGITSNPFRGMLRDRERSRDVTLSKQQIRAVMQCAPYHLRLTIVIAALAPKLRMSNILQLRWDTSFDAAFTTIRVKRHKTEVRTGKAMVAPISEQLRRILVAAKERRPAKTKTVITYHGEPITRIVSGLTKACEAAGVVYGRKNNGATFHTIRHSAATLLAELGVPEGLRKDVMGHLSIQTTQGYTHMAPIHELKPLEQLSAQLPLEDLMLAPRLVGRGVASGVDSGVADPAKRGRKGPKADQQKRAPAHRRIGKK